MIVLVDSSAWSLFYRRSRAALDADGQAMRREVQELIGRGDALLLDVVRQELLTGILHLEQFSILRDRLRGLVRVAASAADHERAAQFASEAIAAGVQGSPVDFLICAVAERVGVPILTLDRDFARYAALLPIRLHEPRGETP